MIFTRLTFNKNRWIIPSGHKWNAINQGNNNISFENQFGFGHEEWLFNPRYQIDGYQYGYIRGARLLSEEIDFVDRIYLYSVMKNNGERVVYYVGYINNVQILGDDWREVFPAIAEVYDEYAQTVIQEIENVNGDIEGLGWNEFFPVVRFQTSDAYLLDEPRVVHRFPLNIYKRFQPYQANDNIISILQGGENVPNLPLSVFLPGMAIQNDRFNRYTSASEKAVFKAHCKIVDGLVEFLRDNYSVAQGNISVEMTRFSGNIADVVTLEIDGTYTIYEIKTSISARKNIREALAQLLDYSSHPGDMIINKLVIVSPAALNEADSAFLINLRDRVRCPISYLQYIELNNDGINVNFNVNE